MSSSKGRRKKTEIKSYSLAGCEVSEIGRNFNWSGGAQWTGGDQLPAERCFLWSAEQLGLHLWCDYPPEIGRQCGGWFAAGRVSTVRVGDRYAYSASRWLADPVESADALLAFAGELQAGCHSLGINLKGSPGTAAVELWRSLTRQPRKADHDLNVFAEEAIYGGRAELFWSGEQETVSQWDRSAAYLAHLTDSLPVTGSERWTDEADLESEGITEALVEVKPDASKIPVLPIRIHLSEREHRTVYGWGRFVGRWPNCELRAARERGYRIKPRGGVTFLRLMKSPVLEKFVERIWEARAKFPLAKRIGLALVGKFHEPRVNRIVRSFGPFRNLREATTAALDAGSGAIVVPHAHVVLALQKRKKFSWYVNMPLAAHILALARLELLRFAESNSLRLCTLATDGAILAGHESPEGVKIGKGLGEWRLDYEADRGVIHGPLAYRLEREGRPDKVRTAGISRALAGKFLAGETVRWKTRAGLMARGIAGTQVMKSARASEYSGAVRFDDYGFAEPPLVKVVRTPAGRALNMLVD